MIQKAVIVLIVVITLDAVVPVDSAEVRSKRQTWQSLVDSIKDFGNKVVSSAESAGSSIKSFFNKTGRWIQRNMGY
ncbi:hypothetical protein O3G_MSEX008678 [Manduca sexta]|uniref:Uncharacterized protein n=1 Tax=Manduca sexta TaxID=7130 RepID=A0A921ZAX0_MANSE|nr:hypothetical protein O3G_MSEX008678 [Manduca sexta]